jgi:diaminopimelate decarboxylase/aspartate kinase
MSKQPLVVLKFGGTSVATLRGWQTIEKLCRDRLQEGFRVLLVHSALAGVTDLIERLLEQAQAESIDEALTNYVTPHATLAQAMGVDASTVIDEHRESLARLLHGVHLLGELPAKLRARALAHGEWLASRLGQLYLQRDGAQVRWLDARALLRTQGAAHPERRKDWLQASISDARDERAITELNDSPWAMTQGFIAADNDGRTLLLGRGGSDTSATLLGARLDAARVEIWTDVPGMFSANPRFIPQARLLRALTYEEAQEIASTGAKVLHPRAVRPVRVHGIPLWVRSTMVPEMDGTVITASGSEQGRVKAVSVRRGITLVSMETVRMWQQAGFLADAFDVFRRHGVSIDLITTAESAVTVSLDTEAGLLVDEQIDALEADLAQICRVRVIRGCAAISLVGRQIRTVLHQLAPAFELFGNEVIHMLGQAANDLNLTVVVEENAADRLCSALHEQLISTQNDPTLYGPSWQSLQQPEASARAQQKQRWWFSKPARLIELAKEHGPCYVYQLDEIKARMQALRGLRNIDRVLYAVKANNHPAILRAASELGLGFETVSPGELQHIAKHVGPGQDVLFTPNFAPAQDYEAGFKAGARVTVDNLHVLENWAGAWRGREVFLRVDLANARGHHSHVRTAGKMSKFGIPVEDLERARQLANQAGVKVTGLHTHAGSGVLDVSHWLDTAVALARVAEPFDHVEVLDLGGGLGVPDRPEAPTLDLAALDASLSEMRSAFPKYRLWLEPGRYPVAQGGVLLTTVTQIKSKDDRHFVGVSTGMNSLIRPALYGAWHDIINLSRLDEPRDRLVTVVGPICETGDRLGSERLLPACREGDILLIDTAGAYGAVMASGYNMRDPAREVVIDAVGARVD